MEVNHTPLEPLVYDNKNIIAAPLVSTDSSKGDDTYATKKLVSKVQE